MGPKKTVDKPAKKPSATKAPSGGARPSKAAPAAATTSKEPEVPDVNLDSIKTISLKEMANALKEADLKASKKWPLLIDLTGQAATFLKYRDVNYLNAMDMIAESCRRGLLGGIRFGKAVVIDMNETNMSDTINARLNEVKDGLWEAVKNWTILKEDYFNTLFKPTDGDDLRNPTWHPGVVDDFQFILVTTDPGPPQSLLKAFYPIKIE